MPKRKDDDYEFTFDDEEEDGEDESTFDEDFYEELQEFMDDFPELDYFDELDYLDDDEDFYSTK